MQCAILYMYIYSRARRGSARPPAEGRGCSPKLPLEHGVSPGRCRLGCLYTQADRPGSSDGMRLRRWHFSLGSKIVDATETYLPWLLGH